MTSQHLIFTKKTNAVIAIKEVIQQLAKNVDDTASYSDMTSMCFNCIETLTGVSNRLTSKLPSIDAGSDIAQAVACVDRAIEHFSQIRPKETDKDEIENIYDLGIDLLNSALSRLGYWRNES